MSKKYGQILKMSRRGFLGRSAVASMGATGMVNTIAHLNIMNALATQQTLDDYRALVCIFQFGGCDWNNGLVPRDGHPQRANYETHRQQVALASSNLNAISPDNLSGADALLGTHPNLDNLASMFNAGDLSFMEGVGTLAYPMTKAEYLDRSVPRPRQLFSHANQQTQWQATLSDQTFSGGWGGKVGKLMTDHANYASVNENAQVSMLVTLAGIRDFLVAPGGLPGQFSVSSSGALSLTDFGTNYSSALNPDGSYQNNATGKRLEYFEMLMNHANDNFFQEGVNIVYRNARASEALIVDAIAEADSLQGTGAGDVNFNGNFGGAANNSLGTQLKMIAKLIAGRKCLGNERQIFFCSLGGWDNHNQLLNNQATRFGQLDAAVGAFNTTMHQLDSAQGDFSYDDFIAFSSSDFDRTFGPNGNDGSDHAWGSKTYAFGGKVNGRNVYGTQPQMIIGGTDDAGGTRGRWIPKHSVEQFASPIAEWFGVQPSDMTTIFPNLPRFDPPGAGNNLDFINFA